MKKNIFIIIVLLLISSCILAKSNDDKEALDKNNKKLELLSNKVESLKKVNKGDLILKLQEEIDLLRTEIEKLKIELLDNNPYATGETLNWCKGLYSWIGYASDKQSSIEIGYVFNIFKTTSKKRSLSKKNSRIRLGVGLGVSSFSDERILLNNKKSAEDIIFYSSGMFYYSKFSIATPVLLNFTNFSTGIDLLYIDPSENAMNITRNRFGLGIHLDINFWFTQDMCFTLGYKESFGFSKKNTVLGKYEDQVLSDNFKFQFGTKFYW